MLTPTPAAQHAAIVPNRLYAGQSRTPADSIDVVFVYGAHGSGALTVDEAVRLAVALTTDGGETQ
jgi:hypothetical protein